MNDIDAWLSRTLRRLPAECCPGVALYLHDLSEAPPPDAVACLSTEEHARAGRFVFDRDRRRFLASHAGLRHVLAQAVGMRPEMLNFCVGPHGKPRLTGAGAALNFNMSHSADRALIGLATDPTLGELGVDLEVDHAVDDVWLLARAQFTPAEVSELRAVAPAWVHRHFLIGWTRKEACLKAVGSGFSITSDCFYGGVKDVPQETRLPTPAGPVRLHVRGADLGDEGVIAAVAWCLPGC